MITIYATAQYYNMVGGHTIKQSPRASSDLYTPRVTNLQWLDQRLC